MLVINSSSVMNQRIGKKKLVNYTRDIKFNHDMHFGFHFLLAKGLCAQELVLGPGILGHVVENPSECTCLI